MKTVLVENQGHNMIVVFRDSIKKGSVEDTLPVLRGLSSSLSKIKACESKVILLVDGYNADPRELMEIPECVKYFQSVTEQWPYWLHFLKQDCYPLIFELLCGGVAEKVIGNRKLTRPSSAENATTAIKTLVDGLIEFHRSQGIFGDGTKRIASRFMEMVSPHATIDQAISAMNPHDMVVINTPLDSKHPRPTQYADRFGKKYPDIWRLCERYWLKKGGAGLDWDDACFLPSDAIQTALSTITDSGNTLPMDVALDVLSVQCIAAWRMGKGIYRFDPDIYDAVRDTPLTGQIPDEVLMRLPEWCVYVETPGMMFIPNNEQMHGFFATMEHSLSTGKRGLVLLADCGIASLRPIRVDFCGQTVEDSVKSAIRVVFDESAPNASAKAFEDNLHAGFMAQVSSMLSMVLYLCSEDPDIRTNSKAEKPTNPQPKKIKGGVKIFAADRPTKWDVGVRMGAALRTAYEQSAAQAGTGEGDGRTVKPHVRRAHWHGFRSGARKSASGEAIPAHLRKFEVKWLPPIIVMGNEDDIPAVIHPVK